MYLIVKTILLILSLALVLSLQAVDKTQYFVHLSFNSILQLINSISSDLQEYFKYFNTTAIVAFLGIPLAWFRAGWAAMFPNNLALYLKYLKLSVLSIFLLKLVASSLE